MERNLRTLFSEAQETDSVGGMLDEAIEQTIEQSELEDDEKQQLERSSSCSARSSTASSSRCRGPTTRCPRSSSRARRPALDHGQPVHLQGLHGVRRGLRRRRAAPVTQTDESVQQLREHWDFWLDLPTTPEKYIRVDDLEEGIGALETILLDKDNYLAFTSGDGACLGCAEKTVLHLFTATVEALMQPRIDKHLATSTS